MKRLTINQLILLLSIHRGTPATKMGTDKEDIAKLIELGLIFKNENALPNATYKYETTSTAVNYITQIRHYEQV
jgi:hypothetical protein